MNGISVKGLSSAAVFVGGLAGALLLVETVDQQHKKLAYLAALGAVVIAARQVIA